MTHPIRARDADISISRLGIERATPGVRLADNAPDYEDLVRRRLALLGEDPEREGLLKTPERVANSMRWLTQGYALQAEDLIGDAIFDEVHENMVLVRDIDFYSMC